MKVDNKVVRQYENPEDSEYCVVTIFERYLSLIPSREGCFYMYFRPLPNDAACTVKFNTLAKLVPNICKAAGIEGYKTGHSGKVTCATTLYRQGSVINSLGAHWPLQPRSFTLVQKVLAQTSNMSFPWLWLLLHLIYYV